MGTNWRVQVLFYVIKPYPKNPGSQTDRVLRAQTLAMEGPTPAMESPRILRDI